MLNPPSSVSLIHFLKKGQYSITRLYFGYLSGHNNYTSAQLYKNHDYISCQHVQLNLSDLSVKFG